MKRPLKLALIIVGLNIGTMIYEGIDHPHALIADSIEKCYFECVGALAAYYFGWKRDPAPPKTEGE